MIRKSVEYYLHDLEDLRFAMDRRQDPGDPVLDWEDVKRELLGED